MNGGPREADDENGGVTNRLCSMRMRKERARHRKMGEGGEGYGQKGSWCCVGDKPDAWRSTFKSLSLSIAMVSAAGLTVAPVTKHLSGSSGSGRVLPGLATAGSPGEWKSGLSFAGHG